MRVALLVAYALLALASVHRVAAHDADEFDGVEPPAITPPQELVLPQPVEDSNLLEAGSLGFAILYAINYVIGRSQNKKRAEKWLAASEPPLVKEFAYTGASANPVVGLLEEGKQNFRYYCTGRRFCSRFVADLQFSPRFDLFSRVANVVLRPSDYVTIDVGLNATDMDPFVFSVTKKLQYNSLSKEFPELITMAKRHDTNQVPEAYCFVTDNIDTPKTALTPKLFKQLTTLEPFLEYFVITDISNKPIVGFPVSERRILRVCFKLNNGSKELDCEGAIALVAHLVDAVGSTLKLPRDIKASAQKKRAKILAERARANPTINDQARLQQELKEKKRQEYEKMSYEEKQKHDEVQQNRQSRKRVGVKKI